MQRIQKVLTQMNLQLANVITDIMGMTGQKILRAILAGERDADKLAEMRNWRIRASHEEIVASLTGNWRPELLFALKQEVDRYDFCQRQIAQAEIDPAPVSVQNICRPVIEVGLSDQIDFSQRAHVVTRVPSHIDLGDVQQRPGLIWVQLVRSLILDERLVLVQEL